MQNHSITKIKKLRTISRTSFFCTLISVLIMLGRYLYTYLLIDPAKITECFQSRPTGILLYIAVVTLLIGIISMNRADKLQFNFLN
jgi:hypothetical protein